MTKDAPPHRQRQGNASFWCGLQLVLFSEKNLCKITRLNHSGVILLRSAQDSDSINITGVYIVLYFAYLYLGFG